MAPRSVRLKSGPKWPRRLSAVRRKPLPPYPHPYCIAGHIHRELVFSCAPLFLQGSETFAHGGSYGVSYQRAGKHIRSPVTGNRHTQPYQRGVGVHPDLEGCIVVIDLRHGCRRGKSVSRVTARPAAGVSFCMPVFLCLRLSARKKATDNTKEINCKKHDVTCGRKISISGLPLTAEVCPDPQGAGAVRLKPPVKICIPQRV